MFKDILSTKHPKPNKLRAALFKLSGSAIVLISVVVQYLWFDHWREAIDIGDRLLLAEEKLRDAAKPPDLAYWASPDVLLRYRENLVSYIAAVEDLRQYSRQSTTWKTAAGSEIAIRRFVDGLQTHTAAAEYAKSSADGVNAVRASAALYRDSAAIEAKHFKTISAIVFAVGSFLLLLGLAYEVRAASE